MSGHHLHTVIVSYKRPKLTEQTLRSWQATVTVPHTIVIVDNGSPPDVVAHLETLGVPLVLLDANRFPGYATNRGWELMPSQTTLLQRSDNDTDYLPGWCDEMVEAFNDPHVGQYGPIAAGDEWCAAWEHWPVGGNSIISRRIYDQGLRYSERPWTDGTMIEEHQLTLDVWAMGYQRRFGTKPGIVYADDGDAAYHAESYGYRGLSFR